MMTVLGLVGLVALFGLADYLVPDDWLTRWLDQFRQKPPR